MGTGDPIGSKVSPPIHVKANNDAFGGGFSFKMTVPLLPDWSGWADVALPAVDMAARNAASGAQIMPHGSPDKALFTAMDRAS